MRSPWEEYRYKRSTSAPPPETPLDFGRGDAAARGNSYLGGGTTPNDRGADFDGLFEDRNRSRVGGLFFDSDTKRGGGGESSMQSAQAPPGFSSANYISSAVPRHSEFPASRFDSNLDRASTGENIIRSQSAAPSFDRGLSDRLGMGPPGFGGRELGSRETPPVSNRTGTGGGGGGGGGGDLSFLSESDEDRSRILQIGKRRPASTGVIGHTQSSSSAVLNSLGLGGGAVRPAAKTLMDLIQEDFPPEGGDMYSDSFSPSNAYMDRPRTTSPLSQQNRDSMYQQRDNEIFGRDFGSSESGGRSGVSQAVDSFQFQQQGNLQQQQPRLGGSNGVSQAVDSFQLQQQGDSFQHQQPGLGGRGGGTQVVDTFQLQQQGNLQQHQQGNLQHHQQGNLQQHQQGNLQQHQQGNLQQHQQPGIGGRGGVTQAVDSFQLQQQGNLQQHQQPGIGGRGGVTQAVDSFQLQQQGNLQQHQQHGIGGRGGVTQAVDSFQLQQQGNLQQQQQPGLQRQGGNFSGVQDRNQPSPQYVAVDRGARPQGDARVEGSIYAPVAGSIQQTNTRQPQQAQYGQQPGYLSQSDGQQSGYGSQTQQIQTQVLPSGQTVYVTGPTSQYGYQTVQYNPHTQQHHIMHQSVPGGMYLTDQQHQQHQQQFISVVPIQGGGGQFQGVGPGGGTFAYVQPNGQSIQGGMGQQTFILSPQGPGGVPLAVAQVRSPGQDSPQQQGGVPHGGRGGGKEKGGKAPRGGKGAANTRRGGTGDSKHQTHTVSSPLLEEFRAKKNRDWTIFEMKGHVVEFCQDQNGSRFIQQRLEVGNVCEKELVMAEVLSAVRRLRNDVFGNYVVQKLFDFGTPKMKEDLRETLQGEMLQLSFQMYGCRVVQKALESLDETELPRLLMEFHNNVLSCIHDQNGNHVIQKCIEVMSKKSKKAREDGNAAGADFFSEQIDFIVDDVLGNVSSLSCHPYGCRVLQRILEHCVEPKKSRALDEISLVHKTLLDDQYGNYVIQHVLQFGRHSDRDSILKIVAENGLLLLSRQKFASNVVEKLLKYGTAQQRRTVVREMLKVVDDRTGAILPAGSEGTSVVLLMVRDAYANYVVQTTLDVISESEEKRLLLEELNAHSQELRNYTFAKHIVTKLST